MTTFDSQYYDQIYFADPKGKEFHRPDGSVDQWGYRNPNGHWDGCIPIAMAWKSIFNLSGCNTDSGLCKSLDVGCGRGQFVTALRDVGVEGWGFDFSKWAIENIYPRCQKGWCIEWDATDKRGFPYGDKAFDFVSALDIFEHLYVEDLDFVIDQIYRVSKRFVFLEIAISGSGGLQGQNGFQGYILKKDEQVSVELEGIAVAGHVTVQNRDFWINKLLIGKDGEERNWKLRDDLVLEFIRIVPSIIIDNWTKNLIIILEKEKEKIN